MTGNVDTELVKWISHWLVVAGVAIGPWTNVNELCDV